MIIQPIPYPVAAAPVETGLQYLASNGVTNPIYGTSSSPAALYVSSTDTTWFAWEGMWGGRAVFVRTYNHTTDTWTDPVIVSTDALNGDDHGVPVLCRDSDGYVHCFFGAHNSSLSHSYTTTADDPSAWTSSTALSGTYSYPKPVLIGTTIYLFLRQGAAGTANTPLVVIPSTSIASGVVTWGTKKTLADPETTLRLYTGAPTVVGSKVHIPGSIADSGDTFRRHVYYFVYDTVNGDLENHDNSTSTASGSLPIGKTTMDTSYRIVDQGTNGGNVPELCIDSNGDPHIIYLDGTGTSYDFKHIVRTSGTWGSATTLDTVDDRYALGTLVPLSGGSIQFYYEDDAGSFTRGGDIKRKVRSSGGTWGSSSTILAADGYGLTHCCGVLNAHADARVLFAEGRSTGSGEMRLYAYGDSGFLTQPDAYETETDAVAAAFTTPPTQRRKELINYTILGLKQTGVWSKLDVLHVYAAADSQAALINWANPGTFNASLVSAPTFTADREFLTDGSASYIDTNFNPATAGGNYSQNSAMFGVYSRSGGVSSSPCGWFDGTKGVTLQPKSSTTGHSSGRANSSGSITGGLTSGSGFYAVNRPSSGTLQMYDTGTLGGSGSVASTTMLSHTLNLGRLTASSFTALKFAACAIGSSLTATEHASLKRAMDCYMITVGANA